MKSKSDLVSGWFLKSMSDLKSARLCLDAGEALDTVCFHAQQASERALKGYLCAREIEFPFIHNLEKLVDLCASVDDEFEQIMQPAQALTPYAVELRYDHEFWPDPDTAGQAVKQAEIIVAFIQNRLPKMDHRLTIGLEVHVQLKTESKMFCGCSTEFGAEPNTHVCPVCLGMPGVLPVINRRALEMAIKTAIALHCTIPEFTKFDRKSYYYPDLPKNYQISQYDMPLSRKGHLDVETSEGTRRIGITRVHLEEDAGKLLHTDAGGSSVDLNRTGTPLMEIVTEPDIDSIEALRAFLAELKLLVTYLDVSNCNMEEGNIRADANISVQIYRDGAEVSSPISEIKNMNSFSACEKAMAFESERLVRRLREGVTNQTHPKETRGWNEDRGVTVGQRQKEEASDYRYFPDPDLPPIIVDEAWRERIESEIPELPQARRKRFIEEYGLSEYDAGVLMADRDVADYFEALAKQTGDARASCVWVSQYVMREMNRRGMTVAGFPVGVDALAELVALVVGKTISISVAQDKVLGAMIETGKSAKEIVDERGLAQVSDTGELEGIVDAVIAKFPSQVEEYRGGKQQVLNFLVGMVMKETKGKANPQVVQEILKKKLA